MGSVQKKGPLGLSVINNDRLCYKCDNDLIAWMAGRKAVVLDRGLGCI